jgi:hypothetical protein
MRARDFLDTREADLILGRRPHVERAGGRLQLERSSWEHHPGDGAHSLHLHLVPEVLGHPDGKRFRLDRPDDGIGPHATPKS